MFRFWTLSGSGILMLMQGYLRFSLPAPTVRRRGAACVLLPDFRILVAGNPDCEFALCTLSTSFIKTFELRWQPLPHWSPTHRDRDVESAQVAFFLVKFLKIQNLVKPGSSKDGSQGLLFQGRALMHRFSQLMEDASCSSLKRR